MSSSAAKVPPPGQQRAYSNPTKTGRIPFEYPKTGLKGETFYKLWGDLSSHSSTRPPLICLHGGPGIPHNYLLPISLIYSDYDIPVIMYDQIGCGGSTRFKEKRGDGDFWSPEMFMAELDNIIEYLGITKYTLLGSSRGGMTAAQYAITRQPKGLKKLIITNSSSSVKLWEEACIQLRKGLPRNIQDTLDQCEKEGKTDSEEYQQALMGFYSTHICRVEPWPQEIFECFVQLKEDDTLYQTTCGPSDFNIKGTEKDWSITEDLHKITQYTLPGGLLVMNGYYDGAQDYTTEAYWSKPSCKCKWVRFALSSHMTMLEETEAFLKVLGDFLSRD